ncbi:MAG: D-tyrosyl-tRNA(Tyr) deacylase [Candidatus Latescibacteria bacterium]|nr:D-tyrosyl-tRNA(Tyr) deacylase [Candidatus Latescibacterota bacterium]
MRVVLQRSRLARVEVEGEMIGEIEAGLVLLIGVAKEDTVQDAQYVMEKCVNLRVFEDEAGKMNRSLLETGGQVLAISQFTLYGDTRKGRRPGFDQAARPDVAEPIYEASLAHLASLGVRVETGRFGAHMCVSLENDGPVTLILESK